MLPLKQTNVGQPRVRFPADALNPEPSRAVELLLFWSLIVSWDYSKKLGGALRELRGTV
jgi:hypothetical protein